MYDDTTHSPKPHISPPARRTRTRNTSPSSQRKNGREDDEQSSVMWKLRIGAMATCITNISAPISASRHISLTGRGGAYQPVVKVISYFAVADHGVVHAGHEHFTVLREAPPLLLGRIGALPIDHGDIQAVGAVLTLDERFLSSAPRRFSESVAMAKLFSLPSEWMTSTVRCLPPSTPVGMYGYKARARQR